MGSIPAPASDWAWLPGRVRLTLPLEKLRHIRARIRYQSRLAWLRENPSTAPPIPLRFDKYGKLELDADGNHRLAAARLNKQLSVTVVVRFRSRVTAERALRALLRG